jgi:hypothetical protein
MSEPKNFPLGVVLTLAHGSNARLFCSLPALYDALGWMLADHPMSTEVDTFIERVRPAVLEQHPELADIKPTRATTDTGILKWLADLEAQHGAELALTPIEGRRA